MLNSSRFASCVLSVCSPLLLVGVAGAQFGAQQVISTTADGAYSVYAIDLDGDGDADVLSASVIGGKIVWYENLGGGAFGAQQVITTDADEAWSVYATDLDGDGDADVLLASFGDNKIAWYENLGGGAFGTQQVITTDVDGPWSVYATDLDGDGDADVLSASANDGKIAWHENLGGGAFGAQQVITTATNGAIWVHATDLDGDGDADVLSASAVDGKIAWYENLGGGAFGAIQVITTAALGTRSAYATDLDGDGDADVLSASFPDDKIAWYENLGGGAFGPQEVITTAADGPHSIYATDLDGDGDADVLSASYIDNKIAWYENLGSGAFGGQQVITTAVDFPLSVYAADLDGDGDADVLSASAGGDNIVWYENQMGTCSPLDDDAFEDNDTCATPSAVADGTHTGLFVSKSDPDYYSFTVADGATLTVDVLFAAANGDLDAMLYESGFCTDDQESGCDSTLACGYSVSDNESLSWTNVTGADVDCILRVHVWPDTPLNCNTYDLVLAVAGPGGPVLFCNPANAHSGGAFATLAASDFSGPGLYHLEAWNGPDDQFGYFLVSAGSNDPGVSISDGRLCLQSPIGRYSPAADGALNSIGRFDVGGVFQNLGGTSSVGSGFDVPSTLPNPPGGMIGVGDTWCFQLWYRDGVASNFSDGISVTF